MTKAIRLAATIMTLASILAVPLSARRTIHVIVFADGYHYGPAGHELARTLCDTAASPAIIADFANTENILVPEALNRYDVLVLFNHNDITRTHEQNITDFVHTGGGLVALHHVLNKANDNPELTRLVGGYYDAADGMAAHRNYNLIRIGDAGHPVLDGIPDKLAVRDDQDFRIQFYPNQDMELLLGCDITDNGSQKDCGWTRVEGAGRVVYLSPGDPVADHPFINNAPLHKLIVNSIRWAAGN